jgi:hypothetical protein
MVAVVHTAHICELAGLDLTAHLTAAVAPGGTTGDSFPNTGRTLFVHLNADGSNAKTVTFGEGSCNFGTDHDKLVSTATSTNMIYGPFPLSKFGTSIPVAFGGTGGITNVKVLILEVPFVN